MNNQRYHHKPVESKWQNYWQESRAGHTEKDDRPKYYVLDMFPYPSGSGLHVGHVVGYTATDIMARFKEMQGFNVLHPMGWDSFGLPAEQYAIRTGTHPAETTRKNIATYKSQLKRLGYSYDWDREIATSHPGFYKWTQWIFTKLFERGLAYEAEMAVNWCPELGTVLANEEVEGGLSIIGGHPVERRPLRQWMLKITAYADRLLEDLDALDWPESIKRLQRNWIGRSEGIQFAFDVENSDEKIEVYTTCPETLMGVTYLVLSPEHPLVAKIATEPVEAYQKAAASKSDFDRTQVVKEKTGLFTGAYAIHPKTKERLPIWIGDYVLMGYGTGAVMAVPAQDERDQEFAETLGLPIKPFNPDPQAADWLVEQGIGKRCVNYKMRDWLFSRQRYWGEPIPIVHLPDGTSHALEMDELPLIPPPVEDYKPTLDGKSPLAKVPTWIETPEGKRETNTMPQWAGSCWYYLRYLDPRNEERIFDPDKEKYWLPVDLYIGGAEHAVLHLLYARFWHKVLHDIGVVSHPEPFKKLFNQGLVLSKSYRLPGGAYVSPEEAPPEAISQIEKMSKSKLNVVNPDDIVEDYGADALRLYEMFMGPLDKEKQWKTEGVSGCRRLLNRFYDLVLHATNDSTPQAFKLAHKLARDVAADLEKLHFNTAIAKLMTFVNDFSKLETRPKEALSIAVQCLAPLAPHICEEMWEMLGHPPSIFKTPFPKPDPQYLIEESVTYVVQVNGKLRGRFDLPKDQEQETIVTKAKEDERISPHLKGEIRKVIFVPNKLINFVVG